MDFLRFGRVEDKTTENTEKERKGVMGIFCSECGGIKFSARDTWCLSCMQKEKEKQLKRNVLDRLKLVEERLNALEPVTQEVLDRWRRVERRFEKIEGRVDGLEPVTQEVLDRWRRVERRFEKIEGRVDGLASADPVGVDPLAPKLKRYGVRARLSAGFS